tara:strand:+ start:176 stop:724 length:549 start_codon:yes stop_codon:yes gene_type:complete
MREDGPEKTKQLFVGAVAIGIAGYLLWCKMTGRAYYSEAPSGYSNVPLSILETGFFILTSVGGFVLGAYRTIWPMIQSFFGSTASYASDRIDPPTRVFSTSPTPSVSAEPTSGRIKQIVGRNGRPIFEVNEAGQLVRAVGLEQVLSGPSDAELLQRADKAVVDGDWDTLVSIYEQLHPEDSE